jgi:hypothetical protein
MSDPILNLGEVVIRKAGGREYVSTWRVSAWLTLTNQRLIIQRLFGDSSSYPLSHVTQAIEYEYWPPSIFAIISFKLLRIDFDNGGALLFGLSGLPDWIQAIDQAKVNAPQMPYTTTPIPRAFRSSAPKLRWVWIGMVAISILIYCVCAPIFLVILFNLNSR